MPNESHLVVKNGKIVVYAGKDATTMFAAAALVAGLKFYARTGMQVARNATITQMLQMATKYTGKKYKRGEALKAAEDVRVWVETMKYALPVVEEK